VLGRHRFDDLVRTERYFTATLLPAILFHNELDGLREFVRLVDRKTEWERSPSGESVRRKCRDTPLPIPLTGGSTQIITEFHIARDLLFAQSLPRDDDAPEGKRDAPDLVIVVGNELIVGEAKFFWRWTAAGVADQMSSQRVQVAHLFRTEPRLRAYRHVAILPDEADLEPDAVVTWGEIAELARLVLGESHYVTERLKEAVARYVPPGDPRKRNWDQHRLSLSQVEDVVRNRQDAGLLSQVGYQEGWHHFRRATYEDLKRTRTYWKWRDPVTNQGYADPKTWIPGDVFLKELDSKKRVTIRAD
jgi:hypothetical protein